jgi:hypothetical protein
VLSGGGLCVGLITRPEKECVKCGSEASIARPANFFSPPVKIRGDSYSFDIAESEYDNEIAPTPTNFKVGGIILKKNVFNEK